MTPKGALDRLDQLLAIVRRCERLIATHTDAAVKSPELTRAVAELRLALTADDQYRLLERMLAGAQIASLRIAIPTVRAALADDQRKLLAKRVA